MLDRKKIAKIVHEVASANLAAKNVDKVLSEPMIDSEGREALRITIVVAPRSVAGLTGDAVLDTLVEIHDRLRQEGEERLPIVYYATADELRKDGD